MFDARKFYRPKDPANQQIAAVQTLAKWRCEGKGPAYHLVGRNVLYCGQDILDWLAMQRVAPR